MKRYYKEENGKRVWFNGVLKSNGKQIINHSEGQILTEGWATITVSYGDGSFDSTHYAGWR